MQYNILQHGSSSHHELCLHLLKMHKLHIWTALLKTEHRHLTQKHSRWN